jgi:hypothetical protein
LITALAAYGDDIENVASSGVPLGISYLDLVRNLVYKRGTPGRGPKTGKRFSCQWAGTTPHQPSDFSEQGEKTFV